MIIGFDGSRAFIKNRTGTENYSYQVLKNLAKIDRKNKGLLRSRSEKSIALARRTLPFANAKRKYIVYIRPGVNPGSDWPANFEFKTLNYPRFWTQIGLSRQTFQEKLDVLFVPAHTLPVIRKPGLKTVVTVHDLGSEYLPKMHQLKQRLYLSLMQKAQLKTATKLIAVSQATKDDLVGRMGIDPKKIAVIYEGWDKKLFKPVKNLSRAKSRDDILVNSLKQFGLKPGAYFLFVGTIQPRKNLARLIKAYAEFLNRSARHRGSGSCRCAAPSDVLANAAGTRWGAPLRATPHTRNLHPSSSLIIPQLVLVGGKGWLSDQIYELPKKLGIEKQVKFLGRIEDRDLPALYSGALALVFPSLFEGFGLPIIEAQACQTPVITSNLSSMPEVAGKGAILVDPYSEKEITNAMIRISNHEDLLIKNGLDNIKRFSWEKCARETLKVLEGVAH